MRLTIRLLPVPSSSQFPIECYNTAVLDACLSAAEIQPRRPNDEAALGIQTAVLKIFTARIEGR